MPLDQLDQIWTNVPNFSRPSRTRPVGPVGPAGPQYILFNCRWPIKIIVKIRAFFEKMAWGIPETKFCNFKIFF
jgi:hypothetical protein